MNDEVGEAEVVWADADVDRSRNVQSGWRRKIAQDDRYLDLQL